MFPFATLHNLDIGERCGSPHRTRKLFEEGGLAMKCTATARSRRYLRAACGDD